MFSASGSVNVHLERSRQIKEVLSFSILASTTDLCTSASSSSVLHDEKIESKRLVTA